MADSTTNIEAQLKTQQADYLKRLQDSGNLPTVISKAWNDASGADTANLRTQEGNLLKDYVAAGANNRAKYADVWDPFARDKLAANETALNYAPIADVRKELAMRADALGVATNSAVAMNNTQNEVAKTNIGFTQDAYSRALAKETAAKKTGTASSSADQKKIDAFNKDLQSGLGAKIASKGEEQGINGSDYITREELIRRLELQHPDINNQDIIDAVYNYYTG